MSEDLKQKIKETAVDHFDRHGYHGASIRKIAQDVDCSLPMIYYYYKNKASLFHEIIKEDYFNLLKKEADRLDPSDIVDYYTQFVFNLNELSSYERKIYRLGIKVYLHFDGDEELRTMMDAWEQTILPRHYEILKPYLKDAPDSVATARTLIHLLENLIESIVVKNRHIDKEDIRSEIRVVLKLKQ